MNNKRFEITSSKIGKTMINAANEEDAQLKAENLSPEDYKWDDNIEIQSVVETEER